MVDARGLHDDGHLPRHMHGAVELVAHLRKCGLLESYCAWALSRPKVVRRFGWGYFSAMGDMPWFFPGPMKGAKELAFKTIHIMEDAK